MQDEEALEPIDAGATVRVHLTGLGVHVVREYLGKPRTDRSGPKMVALPLWEALRILGPHSVSSIHCPISSIEFDRPASETERRAEVMRENYSDMVDGLRALLLSIGIDVAYQAPETLPCYADCYVTGGPRLVPDGAGWWWLGGDVVRVVWAGGGGDGERLDAVLGNNHRKPVLDLDGWGGPAIRDPRLVAREPDADEDIPF